MSVYEFICSDSNCEHAIKRFDYRCLYEEIDKVVCPKCGSKGIKQISIPTPQFIGEGWTLSADEKESVDVWKDKNPTTFYMSNKDAQ